MPQSLSQQYLHLVFGTKEHAHFINEGIESMLHAYIAGILKNLESPAIIINSMPNHIHILFRLSKNYALSNIVEEIKKQSSKWMKGQGIKNFTWQIGYGAFSVSSSRLKAVSLYIKNQKTHHEKKNFQEEVEEFFKEYNVKEFDSTYFWT